MFGNMLFRVLRFLPVLVLSIFKIDKPRFSIQLRNLYKLSIRAKLHILLSPTIRISSISPNAQTSNVARLRRPEAVPRQNGWEVAGADGQWSLRFQKLSGRHLGRGILREERFIMLQQ